MIQSNTNKAVTVQYNAYSFAVLSLVTITISWIVPKIVMTHATTTAFLILCPVTISRYLKENFTAIYRSPLIKNRKVSVAMLCTQKTTTWAFSNSQNGPISKARFTLTAMAMRITTNPASKSVPAKQAKSLFELVRSCLFVATTKMTNPFNETVGISSIERIHIKAIKLL